jgi:hypothetical protein
MARADEAISSIEAKISTFMSLMPTFPLSSGKNPGKPEEKVRLWLVKNSVKALRDPTGFCIESLL